MAAVEKLGDELLTCSICYDFYNQPKVLPCLHSFCQDCVGRHFEIHKLRNQQKLSCPTCRELFSLPLGGVSGLRNDNVVGRTRELLQNLPVCLEDEKDESVSNDSRPLMACGFNAGAQELQKETLYVQITHMQNALARLRSKQQHLYAIENCIKRSIESEIKAKLEDAEKRGENLNGDHIEEIKNKCQSSFQPSIAQLVSEQDKVYQRIVDIKAVHDVCEEVLGKATPEQFDDAYEPLMEHIKSVEHLVQLENQSSPQSASPEHFVKEFNIPACVFKDASFSTPHNDSLVPKETKSPKGNICVEMVAKITGHGVNPGEFDFPTCASFVYNGDIVVCDKNNLRLQLFNDKLELKSTLHQGQLKPRKASVCPHDGFLYVCDELSQTIKVFSPEGKMLRRIGEGILQSPEGLAFNSMGHLIVSDPEKCYIYTMKRNGSVVSRFFCRFLDDKCYPNPYFLVVNDDDQIIVSDFRNSKVRVFSKMGQPLFSIPKLVVPRGICIDPYGNILIAESDKHKISMYSPYGKFIRNVIEPKQFGLRHPMSIDMNDKGQLLVSQCGFYQPHEIMLFQVY